MEAKALQIIMQLHGGQLMTLKSNVRLKAKFIIHQALEDGDLKTADKVIDRVERLQNNRTQANQHTTLKRSLDSFYTQ
jgi:PBP1b-binding outer membrane lipoprotein LpoB